MPNHNSLQSTKMTATTTNVLKRFRISYRKEKIQCAGLTVCQNRIFIKLSYFINTDRITNQHHSIVFVKQKTSQM